jgi:aspartyl/asparaginyl beta-hydroxylase (cupin superfamily)
MPDIDLLSRRAGDAAKAGRWTDAETLWREVHRLDPRHSRALFSLGVHALRDGRLTEARTLLEKAQLVAPSDPIVFMTLLRVLHEQGDAEAELRIIDAALAADAYFLPALLAKGEHAERQGSAASAALHYRNAVKIAPPPAQWPDLLRAQLAHAQTFAEQHGQNLQTHLGDALAPLLAGLPPAIAERWRESASIMSGRTQPYVQQANQLHVARLPPIPFYERTLFPWAAALEAQTAAIRDELRSALAAQPDDFTPYIALRPGQPVDQWAQLNNSTRWSHLSLWRNGRPDKPNLARCPRTRAALEAVDMASIGGLCPNAMFSALAPRSHIPPHTGETNARLVAHLPLIVPAGCTFRVGYDTREWREGELLVFDDTIQHEARNDSDELRVVLIFDIWNPLLAPEERAIVQALAAAARTFGAG